MTRSRNGLAYAGAIEPVRHTRLLNWRYEQEVLADAPVAYWRLGELSGTTALASAGASTGTYTGGYTLGQASLVGDGDGAIALNGSTGYVDIAAAAAINITSGTCECWFQTPAPGAGYAALIRKNSSYNIYIVAGVLEIWANSPGTSRSTSIRVDDGMVHHAVLTFQSGSANGTLVYLDGKLVLTTTITVTSSALGLRIGTDASGTQCVAGTVDDVAVYSTLLSPVRIRTHYLAGTRSMV